MQCIVSYRIVSYRMFGWFWINAICKIFQYFSCSVCSYAWKCEDKRKKREPTKTTSTTMTTTNRQKFSSLHRNYVWSSAFLLAMALLCFAFSHFEEVMLILVMNFGFGEIARMYFELKIYHSVNSRRALLNDVNLHFYAIDAHENCDAMIKISRSSCD